MPDKSKPKMEKLEGSSRDLTSEGAEAVGGCKHVANIKWTPGKASVGAGMKRGSYPNSESPPPPPPKK